MNRGLIAFALLGLALGGIAGACAPYRCGDEYAWDNLIPVPSGTFTGIPEVNGLVQEATIRIDRERETIRVDWTDQAGVVHWIEAEGEGEAQYLNAR